MKKSFISVAALAAVILGIVFVVDTSNYLSKYSIRDYAADIEKDIENRLGMDIVIRDRVVTDNKLHFVFTVGQTVGSGELTRGWNRKYKFEYFGHGTNGIRERIVETDKGQYLMLAGRNDENIGSIRAFIEGETYDAAIPDGPYYLVMTPVKRTRLEFTSGMIVYDREGRELRRMNLPADETSSPAP